MKTYALTLIKNPSGTYSFVGSVPMLLAYARLDGEPVTAEFIDSQLMLPANKRKIASRSWAYQHSALEEAQTLGLNPAIVGES